MKRTATVVEHNGRLMGRVERTEACMQCHACEYGQKEETFVPLPSGDWQEGDMIDIELQNGRISSASFLAYGIPLLGLITGLVVGHFVSRIGALSGASDIVQAACGVIGVAVGFMVLRSVEKRVGGRYRPEITKCSGEDSVSDNRII